MNGILHHIENGLIFEKDQYVDFHRVQRTKHTPSTAKVQIDKNFQRKIVKKILSISFNICFGCSKEQSH